MLKLIDVACPGCGRVTVDMFVKSLEPALLPLCRQCGVQVERAWAFVKAPGITPQGTRAEINTDKPRIQRVDSTAIAAETALEVEQKWLRYSDEKIAEQHVSREINEAAGIADSQGNEIPIPKPAPLVFEKPSAVCNA